jgi:hypothetical protein
MIDKRKFATFASAAAIALAAAAAGPASAFQTAPSHICNNLARYCNQNYQADGYASAEECWIANGGPEMCPEPSGGGDDGGIFGPDYGDKVRTCGGWLDCNR